MSRDNLFWKMQRGELAQPASARTFERRIAGFDPEAATLEATFVVGDDYLNPAGTVQGGILVALLDDTLGPTLSMLLDVDEFAPFLNLNASFVRAGRPGSFTGHGRVVSRGRRVCFLEGRLLDADDRLVATATATATVLRSDGSSAAPRSGSGPGS